MPAPHPVPSRETTTSPLPAPPLPPPAAAPAVRSARFSPLYSEPTSCASRHRRRRRRETGRRGREGRKGRGQRWAGLSARHRESRVVTRSGGWRAESRAWSSEVRSQPPPISRDHVVGTQAEVSRSAFGMKSLQIPGKGVNSGDTRVQC